MNDRPLGDPPNQGSGGKRPDIRSIDDLPSGVRDAREERADKSSWVGIVSAFLLFGREISGTRVTRNDVSGAIDVAEQLYNETTVVCHAPPTRAL